MDLPEGIKMVRVEVFLASNHGGAPEVKVFEADQVENVIVALPAKNGSLIPCAPTLITRNGGQRSEWFGFPFIVVTEESAIVVPKRPHLQPA